MKPDILLSKLTEGYYHTKSSKSDIKHSKTIKTVIKNFPYFKDYTGNDLTYFITNHLNYLYDTLNHVFTKNSENVIQRLKYIKHEKNYILAYLSLWRL
jgi:hypothetical protein